MTDLIALAEIEHSVSLRARETGVDARAPGAAAAIAALAHDEVRKWNLDFKRGVRSSPVTDASEIADRVRRDLLGYGPLEELLTDPDVWEVMVNAPHEIFVKRHRGASGRHDEVFHDSEHVRRTLTRIIDDATASHRKLDPREGLQDAQLDDGARLHIVHPDIGRGGNLIFNIRKFTGIPFSSLRELAAKGSLTDEIAEFLGAAVRARLSILIAGAPGSGKTTLLGCCAAELDPHLRVVTAEEVFELDIPLPNVAAMQTRPGQPERAAVDLRRLVSGFLRMAPDVAIVGEVRDREAVPLLLTLSSGVTGYATIHAGSARQALGRLRLMCQLAAEVRDMPVAAITHLVAESIDLVVHLQRGPHGVRVTEIAAVEEPGSSDGIATFEITPLFAMPGPDETARRTQHAPLRAAPRLATAGFDPTTTGSGEGASAVAGLANDASTAVDAEAER